MNNLQIYKNITQCLTLAGVKKKMGRNPLADDLGIIEKAAIVTRNSTIEWVGNQVNLPETYQDIGSIDCSGEVWLPQFVECHTHLVYSGTRHHDFSLRCEGKSYLEIAAKSGGILSTIVPTRQASVEELCASALLHLEQFKQFGVGAVEIKSGYGLSLESEIKLLECVRELQKKTPLRLVPTFMPAHAIPPEFKGRADDYVSEIIRTWIPEVEKRKLSTFFDVFIEGEFFSAAQGNLLCQKAAEHGLKLKLHTDQYTDIGGTDLALTLGATSCDHLDHISSKNIARFAKCQTVAVLLPGASLFAGTKYPPARELIDAGARVALSTDFNPGTCPSHNLALMTTIACAQMKMTVPEAIVGITYNAAAALELENEIGTIEVGNKLRVTRMQARSYEEIPYSFGELGFASESSTPSALKL